MDISGSYYTPTVLSRASGLGGNVSIASMLKYSRTGNDANRSSGITNLQTTLNNMDALASRQRIMAGAIGRVQDIAAGRITPTADWELTSGYLAQTGVPFKLEVSQTGEIIVNPQSDLIDQLPLQQQGKMREALERLEEVRGQFDEEVTKEELRDKLHYAMLRVTELENFAPIREDWEEEFERRKTMGRPMMIGLNKDGELDVFDQKETNFDYVEDDDKRLKLQLAMAELEAIFEDMNKVRKQSDSLTVTTSSSANNNSTSLQESVDDNGVKTSTLIERDEVNDGTYITNTTTTTTTSVYPAGADVPDTKEDLDNSDNETTTISVDPTTGATTITTVNISKQVENVEDSDDDEDTDSTSGIVTETQRTDSRTTDENDYMTTATTTVTTTTVPAGEALPDIPEDDDNTSTTVTTDPNTGETTIVTTTTSSKTEKVYDDIKAATELWQYSALGKRSSGEDYFLDIDDDGEVVIRANTAQITQTSILPSYLEDDAETEFHIVPEYLRDAGNYDFYDNSWEEDAMGFYANKQPYYIDLSGSRPRAMVLDYNAIMLEDLLSNDRAAQLRQAQVSLLY